jgi:GT2 family glycosyltransferase
MKNKLSIITVTWKSKDLIGTQIESVVLGCKNTSFEQIVVDNASSDSTVSFVETQYPHVRCIANNENKGFAAANNQALSLVNGEFLLFLNPDMRLTEGSLDVLVNWMETHPGVGVASVKLLDENGQVNADALPRRFPRIFEQVALILKLPHLFPHLLDTYLMKGFDASKEQDVDSVRGSFMMVRSELIQKLGFAFDPRYFIWFEDVDLCREAKRLGYRVVHTPVISAVDYIGQSFKQRESLWKQKNFTASMLTYFQKWEPWWKWMWIALFRPVGIFLVFVSLKIQKK